MVKQTILNPKVVRFFFFAKERYAVDPVVSSISISPSGEISEWPDGFFDQLDKDLGIILT
jgi:predicted ATPase